MQECHRVPGGSSKDVASNHDLGVMLSSDLRQGESTDGRGRPRLWLTAGLGLAWLSLAALPACDDGDRRPLGATGVDGQVGGQTGAEMAPRGVSRGPSPNVSSKGGSAAPNDVTAPGGNVGQSGVGGAGGASETGPGVPAQGMGGRVGPSSVTPGGLGVAGAIGWYAAGGASGHGGGGQGGRAGDSGGGMIGYGGAVGYGGVVGYAGGRGYGGVVGQGGAAGVPACGNGGTGDIGGSAAGGAGGAAACMPWMPMTCSFPPLAISLAPWEADEQQRSLDEALERAIAAIPGDWHGTATSPWEPPYEVSLSFTTAGGYSAHCAWSSNMCCVAFYYGTDDDTPLKRYQLDQISIEGHLSGSIDIVFSYPDGLGGVRYDRSGYDGAMKEVELDATRNRLRFQFWYGDHYGPILYDLERTPPR